MSIKVAIKYNKLSCYKVEFSDFTLPPDHQEFVIVMCPQTIEIKIADRMLKVACPQGQESALVSAANELNDRLEKTRNSPAIATPEQNLMLTALNLSNDLLQLRQETARERQETKNQIQLLQSTIEQALIEQKSNGK